MRYPQYEQGLKEDSSGYVYAAPLIFRIELVVPSVMETYHYLRHPL